LLCAAVAACALLAVADVPASAVMIAVPADAPTVATSPSGAAVIAWVGAGDQLCTAVQLMGAMRPAQIDEDELFPVPGRPSGGCVELSTTAQFDAQSIGSAIITQDRHMTWGSAGLGVATVELRRHGAVFGAGPSSPSPLSGAAADLGFFAIEHPAGPVVDDDDISLDRGGSAAAPQPDELVVRDAFGVVRRVNELIEPSAVDGPVLQRGHRGKTTWVLGQTVTRELAPTPLEPERREARRCLAFRVARSVGGGPGFCDGDPDPDDGQPYLLEAAGDCLVGGRVEVLVREPARRVVAILGDGRRRTVPLVTLSPGTRAGTLVLGPDVAVRRTLALSATGRVLMTQFMRLPPQPRHGCLESLGDVPSQFFRPPMAPIGAGPHVMRATDHGVRICVAVDRAARVPEECALPPVDPYRTWLTVEPTSSGRVIYGIVPAEIAAVRVTRKDGSVQTIASAPIVGYTGRYAAALRQVAVELRGGALVAEVAVLDARGRVLRAPAGDPDGGLWVARPRTVLRVPGLPPLRAVDTSSGLRRGSCLWLGSPMRCVLGLFRPKDEETSGWLKQIEVGCAPRRIVVAAVLLRRADRLVVRTTSGRPVTAHHARIPAGSGPISGLYAHLAVLGPHEGLSALVERGPSGKSTISTPLPPATRQCGYSVLPNSSIPEE
jgi:hypothetical protein